MKKLLVVVDFQNDFISGALGTSEAVEIIPNVINKITDWKGDIAFTADTHYRNYLETNEGKHLPIVHCVRDTDGWELHPKVAKAVRSKMDTKVFEKVSFLKNTFGSISLMNYISSVGYEYVEFIGLCTDICVVSNAIMAKTFLPEAQIVVDPTCCAGTTPESHNAAIMTMAACQIDILEATK